MKKLFVRTAIVLVMAVIAALGVSIYLLGSIVKRGVEVVGPQITKTDVKLDGATLSLVTGSGTLSGLFVGNPQGFKAEWAIKITTVSIGVAPATVFSDKVWVREVSVLAPEITFEKGLGASNLAKLLDNVQATTAASTKPGAASQSNAASKKLQVDDLLVSDGEIKLTVDVGPLAGRSATVPLPQIHLTNLGTAPAGITAEELASKVLKEVLQEAIRASGKAMVDLEKGSADVAGDAGETANEGVGNATDGLGGLIKKK